MIGKYEERDSWICVCLFSFAKVKGGTSGEVGVNATLEYFGVEVGKYFYGLCWGFAKDREVKHLRGQEIALVKVT